jgi:hypothetical protein
VALDGTSTRDLDLITDAPHGGPAGGRLTLVIHRNAVERAFRLVRRRLL